MNQLLPLLADFASGAHGLLQPPSHCSRMRPAACAGATVDRKANAGMYGIRPCITQIDRAIIRGHYRQDDAAAQTREFSEAPASGAPWRSLPPDLECKLSVLTDRYVRALADGDVVLIDIVTATIIDVMRHVHAQTPESSQSEQYGDGQLDAGSRRQFE